MATRTPNGARRWKLIRDILLFAVGAVGFFHEVFLVTTAEHAILVASAAFMGAPLVLRADEGRRK